MSSFVKDYCIDKMTRKGVDFEEMAEILFDLQKKHMPTLTLETCREHLDKVMDKREVQNAILTGLCLDEAAEKGYMEEPLHEIVSSDDGLYGVDEVLALSIVNIYGSIGLTNFGFLDKAKPGLIGRINEKIPGRCTTFLDDIVCALIAAGASRIAHKDRDNTLDE